jgi:hypothetical protein
VKVLDSQLMLCYEREAASVSKHHYMKTYRDLEVMLHILYTSQLDGGIDTDHIQVTMPLYVYCFQ